jgi:hypothetical protein
MKIRHGLAVVTVLLVAFITSPIGRAAKTQTAGASPQGAAGTILPIGNVFQIANQQNVFETRPDVAYNSIHQEYLVVWHDDGLYATVSGQRISKNGSLIGSPFQIANEGQNIDRRYPRLAYDAKSDQYLVVWLQSDSSQGTNCICGRRVEGSGTVIDSSDIQFSLGTTNVDTFSAPTVGYAYTSNRYLVAWTDANHPNPPTLYNVIVRAMLAEGYLFDGRLINGEGGSTKTAPELAYNSLVDQFMVIWQQEYPSSPSAIIGIVLTADGTPVTIEKSLATYGLASAAPVIASLPIPPYGQYLVAWESHYAANDSDIQARIFSPYGDPLTNDFYVSNIRGVDETQPAIAASGTRGQYMVTWRQSTILTWGLTGGRIATPSGAFAGDPINLGGWNDGHSRVAAGWSGDFLTVYDDTPFTPDIGIYGILAGNRIYLPLIKK